MSNFIWSVPYSNSYISFYGLYIYDIVYSVMQSLRYRIKITIN